MMESGCEDVSPFKGVRVNIDKKCLFGGDW